MKKLKQSIPFLLVALFSFFVGFYAANRLFAGGPFLYESWNVLLPGGAKQEYRVTSFGALGDGESFTVYAFHDKAREGSFYEKMSSQKNAQLENEVGKILRALRADAQWHPDFSHEYRWKIRTMESDSRNKLYIIYDEETSFLYYAEDIY